MKLILWIFMCSVVHGNAQSPLDLKIKEGVKMLDCPHPDERDPVTMSASFVQEGDSIGVIIKARLSAGWHIYDYVPSNLPYIPVEYILQMPATLRPVGEWKKSQSSGSAIDPGVLIYEDEALFIHKATKVGEVKAKDVIKTGLYYQTCNLLQCLPPVEKTIELKITANN